MLIKTLYLGMQKEPTIESSEAGRTTEDYKQMNTLFNEYGVEDEDEREDGGKVKVRDFSVSRVGGVLSNNKARVTFFLDLPDGSQGKISGEYSVHHTDDSLEILLNELGPDKDLSSLFGMDFYAVRAEDTWKLARNGTVIKSVADKPEWNPSRRVSDQKTFTEIANARSETDNIRKGTGKIVDYYVQKSASNIEQNLEIGICVLTPNESLEWYECIHDSECPDDGLELIMDYANAEEIRDLRLTEVPMVFTTDEGESQWNFHIRNRTIGSVLVWLERIGVKSISEDRSLIPVDKTYGHAQDSDKNTGIRKDVEQALVLEQMNISVHS